MALVGDGERVLVHQLAVVGKLILETFVEKTCDLVLYAFALVSDLVAGRDTQLRGVVDCDDLYRDGLVVGFLLEEVCKFLLDSLAVNILLELHNIVAATREVDTLVHAADCERCDTDHDEGDPYHRCCLPLAEEVDLRVGEEVAAHAGGECHAGVAAVLGDEVKRYAGQEDCCEERADDTDDKRCGKALDRT